MEESSLPCERTGQTIAYCGPASDLPISFPCRSIQAQAQLSSVVKVEKNKAESTIDRSFVLLCRQDLKLAKFSKSLGTH